MILNKALSLQAALTIKKNGKKCLSGLGSFAW